MIKSQSEIILTSLKVISASAIKSRKKEKQFFFFNYVSYKEVLNEIRKLQTATIQQQDGIPTKILKENSKVFARYFRENIKICFENSIFLSDLKVADVTPAFKKKSKTSTDSYRPTSILPNISKIYERCFYNQIQTLMKFIETSMEILQRI